MKLCGTYNESVESFPLLDEEQIVDRWHGSGLGTEQHRYAVKYLIGGAAMNERLCLDGTQHFLHVRTGVAAGWFNLVRCCNR